MRPLFWPSATAMVSTGLALQGATDSNLMKQKQSYLAAGFYWMQAAGQPVANDNEYGIELTYVLQLTETMTLQPDFQVIFNPANNPGANTVTSFTLQLAYTW